MKACILSAAIFFTVTGCGPEDAGAETQEITVRCIDGVEYYLFREKDIVSYYGYGYMSPKFSRDGAASLCGVSGESP